MVRLQITDVSSSVIVFLVRSPALRSPRSGTPRRHLITPIPGTWPVFLLLPLTFSLPGSHLVSLSLSVRLMESLSSQRNIR